MKNNKLKLITSVLDILAGIFFAAAAVMQTDGTSKILMCAASVLFLIAGVGMLFAYVKGSRSK